MRSGLIYIGNNVYQRTTVLIELQVLEYLQRQASSKQLTFSGVLNMLLLRSLKEEKESERV